MRDPFEGLFLDELTGLYNRRYLNLRLQEELARGRRSGEGVALLLLDLDHFKDINDTLGHLAGDDALRTVSERLHSLCRGSDLLFRYGGDEFVVVCPGAGETEALGLAGRLCEGIAELGLESAAGVKVTLSVGVSLAAAAVRGPQGLLDAADRALYRAKAAGRSRAEVAQAVPVSETAPFLRGEELATVLERLEGAARLVVVTGEHGIGKTHILEELARTWQGRGGLPLWAACYTGGSLWPYYPLRGVLAELVAGEHSGVSKALADEYRLVLEPLLTRGASGGPMPHGRPQAESGARLVRIGLKELVGTATKPLLIFDDLERADGATLDWLRFLWDEGAAAFPVAASVGPGTDGGTAAREQILSWAGRTGASVVALEAVPDERLAALVGEAHRFSRDEQRQLLASSGGNPGRLLEMVELGISPEADPRTVVANAMRRRLAQFSPVEQEWFGMAASLEKPFDVSELSLIVGGNVVLSRLIDFLDRAVTARVIERVPRRGQEKFRFRLRAVREHLLAAMLKKRDLARVGRPIAAQPMFALAGEARVSAAAPGHWEAYHVAMERGRTSLALYAFAQAEQGFREALRHCRHLPFPAQHRLAALEGLADSLRERWQAGMNVDIARQMEEAARRVGSLDGIARAWEGRLHMATYGAERFREGIELANRLRKLLPKGSVALGRVMSEKGWILYYTGSLKAAERAASEAAACLRGSRAWTDLGAIENLIGSIRMTQRRLDEARRHLRRALVYWRRAGELFRVPRYHNNMGNVDYTQGRLKAALRHYRIGLRQASRLMDRLPMAYLQVNLAATLLHLGRLEESLASSEAARDLARQMGESFLEVDALTNHAWALFLLWRHDACSAVLRTIVRLSRKRGEPNGVLASRLMQCHIAASRSEPRHALGALRLLSGEGVTLNRSQRAIVAAIEGWAREATGDHPRAAAQFRKARQMVRRGVDPDIGAVADYYQGLAYAARGQRRRAKNYLGRASTVFRRVHRGWLPLVGRQLQNL
jgi:diguanylate cyclase (GGDEF)-like protein